VSFQFENGKVGASVDKGRERESSAVHFVHRYLVDCVMRSKKKMSSSSVQPGIAVAASIIYVDRVLNTYGAVPCGTSMNTSWVVTLVKD